MIAAALPNRRGKKLIVVTPSGQSVHEMNELPSLTRPGDVWIVNDAATFPASLHGRTSRGAEIELRLLPHRPGFGREWTAVVFGSGNWRTPTEKRPPPPELRAGERVVFGNESDAPNASLLLSRVSPLSPRLVVCDFERPVAETWAMIYRFGKPVQYSHLQAPIDLHSFQTAYAGRPWASEMPSAGYPLGWELLARMRERGVHLHFLTHSTGLSSTGDEKLDSLLPLPEFFDIPESTVRAIQQARVRKSRIVAVGTSVMRALEGRALEKNRLEAGTGETSLRIGAGFRRKIVDGIFSGVHSPGESHFELLQSFLTIERLESARKLAQASGFRSHEFGDSTLILV